MKLASRHVVGEAIPHGKANKEGNDNAAHSGVPSEGVSSEGVLSLSLPLFLHLMKKTMKWRRRRRSLETDRLILFIFPAHS